MVHRNLTPENTEFVILSFEGPDRYALAGGLGARISHLSQTLGEMGFRTHHFFIGDPHFAGEEMRCRGRLILHRWCQWISQYYPLGVYQGEDEKWYDFNNSIPWYVMERIVKPAAEKGKMVVIMGEEWQTAEAMCRLDALLLDSRLRERVIMFWNANNTFSFHRIDWARLSQAATITTVSRYMKHILWAMRVNPVVIPNGIPKWLLWTVPRAELNKLRKIFSANFMVCKVGRWDPDKRWDAAVEAISFLKDKGMNPILFARGGIEPYGQEVINRASLLGLKVAEARLDTESSRDYLSALTSAVQADVVNIRFHLPLQFLRILYKIADAVLANSSHEPFGLVGLEAMAAGGAAFTGSTGEDYAIHLVNSVVLETADPAEIVGYTTYLQDHPKEHEKIRWAARETAGYFTWDCVVRGLISKLEIQARIQGFLAGKGRAVSSDLTHPTYPYLEGIVATS